ncbi:MAG: EAL domain-containing protein, partial [Sulfurimonas sp.]|nr:EAL domain-containing protein [Sulfurimonas sp.]
IENNLSRYRDDFFQNKLNSSDAEGWFKLTTSNINELKNISSIILSTYIENANIIKKEAKSSLFVSAFLWIISFISFMVLIYILKQLISKEKHIIEELKLLAYTFNSHEAMTITNANGIIIKVNQAFSDITGYQASEVIGKNPRVLKSMKHSEEFYKEMWHQLHTVGKWSAEIYNKRKNGEIYLERLSITAIKDEKNITTHYIAQFLDISDLKAAQDKAEYQADHDFLTGLINRKTLMSRLNEEFKKAKRHDFLHAFLFIDLDNFKTINDTYGHNIGDMLIIEVANRLKNNLREEDVICRLGGDEFAIMLLNIDKSKTEAAKDVKDICTNLLNSVNKPFLLKGHKLNVSSSIGVKLFPDNTKTIDDIVIHADTAMYQAKKLGKNQFVFFDAKIEMEMKNLLKQEKEIKSAFTNNEFEFYYQPKVDVSTGRIIGAEMLARWNHPTKGLLYPDSFIDISNNLGLIHNFTKIALKDASEFLHNYSNIFTGSLAINISSTELLHQNFEQEIIDFLKNNNIKPEHIEFEITETEIINNFELIIEKIKKLQNIGINFSIDDFGTGYSSLAYLQKLPVNTLKIDREFFLELHLESSRELLRLMSNMAKTFNMSIVAEGIENKSQLDFIKEINVEQYQGFYMSKALKEDQFINLLGTV